MVLDAAQDGSHLWYGMQSSFNRFDSRLTCSKLDKGLRSEQGRQSQRHPETFYGGTQHYTELRLVCTAWCRDRCTFLCTRSDRQSA